MSFNKPDAWTRMSGHPDIQGSGSGITLVDKFWTTYNIDDIFRDLPEIESVYDTDALNPQILQLQLSTYTVAISENGSKAIITLNYTGGSGSIQTQEAIAEFYLEGNTIEQDIQKHADFLMKWKYHLYQYKESGSVTVPTWWTDDTVRDPDHASGKESADEYLWTQDNPGGKWKLVKARTKPEVESYIVPAPVVQERTHYRRKISAQTAATKVGTLLAPADQFGLAGQGEWLVVSSRVQRDGRRFLVERSFQFATDWDDELYPLGD